MLSVANIRAQLRRLLHLDESPHRAALAFAVGVFIAFSPTYGLHTITVFFCAWAFRMNVVALFAGALVNNPWTIVPILGMTLWAGFQLLGMPDTPPFQWQQIDLDSLYQYILPYFVPFFAGGIVLGILGALISYPIAYFIISTYKKRIREEQAAVRLPHESS